MARTPMKRTLSSRGTGVLTAAIVAGLSGTAHGQADFFEGFEAVGGVASGEEGPSGLTAQGWIFRNQSSPAVGAAWIVRGDDERASACAREEVNG